jgi:hypothetical protein
MSTEKQVGGKIEARRRGTGSSDIQFRISGHTQDFSANHLSGSRFYVFMTSIDAELRIEYGKRLSEGPNVLAHGAFGVEFLSPSGNFYDSVTGGSITVTVSGGTFDGELNNVDVAGLNGTVRLSGTYDITI